jgi:prepilin-type N-terminal cleavage/methylation domain-containing protein
MKKKKGFTLVELLVVIAVIALLLSILMPALNKVKRQAQGVACRAHLSQWALSWDMYLTENNYKFPNNRNASQWEGKQTWMWCLKDYYKNEDLLLCPSSMSAENPRPFKAWDGSEQAEDPASSWWNIRPYVKGSYAQNKFCISMPLQWLVGKGWADKSFADSKQKCASEIPLLGDSSWFAFREVCYNDGQLFNDPPQSPQDGGGSQGMRGVCLARHGLATNLLFVDLSTRTVGLKALWDLKWNRIWENQKRDGLIPADEWPKWME